MMKPVSLELSSTPHYFYFNIIFEDRTKKMTQTQVLLKRVLKKELKKVKLLKHVFGSSTYVPLRRCDNNRLFFLDVNHSPS